MSQNSKSKIKRVIPRTENPYVNLYELEAVNKKGGTFDYYVASRAKSVDQMKLKTGKNTPDGVIIFAVRKGTTAKEDQIVLVRQYRYTLDDTIYEFPAGLVEPGEHYRDAAVREMKEETGLTFRPLHVDERYERPFFTTVGMTDESCAAVYGYVEGEISSRFLEDSEELEVVLADRKEAVRILKEENVAIMCAYQMMHFIQDEDVFGFLQEKTEV